MREEPIYITEKEVTLLTGRALSSLRNDRFNRQGFPYIKMGRSVRYNKQDIIAFMEKRKIQTEAI